MALAPRVRVVTLGQPDEFHEIRPAGNVNVQHCLKSLCVRVRVVRSIDLDD